MNKEISVLRHINSDGDTTQRDIAKITGMSLGNVNASIKNLILKGFLFKKANNDRDVRYILTDEGKRRKSIAILDEYSEIVKSTQIFQKKIEDMLKEYCLNRGLFPIVLGENDQIKNFLIDNLNRINVGYMVLTTEELYNINSKKENSLFIIWHPDVELELKNDGLKFLHILDEIDKCNII